MDTEEKKDKKEKSETPETKLQVISHEITQVNLFGNKEGFEHIQRVATMFSKSDLVPKKYQGNIGNCVIALEIAARIGASPLMVMQNLDVILGRPAWSSTFLIATLNASGKFSNLRYENEVSETEGIRCRAWAIDKLNSEKVYGVWVSMKMATDEGWVNKSGSKWKTMAELMIRYRAASFFTKQFAPEISMGLQTIEEVYDSTPIKNDNIAVEDLQLLYDMKADSLSEDEKINAERIIKDKETTSFVKLHKFLKEK